MRSLRPLALVVAATAVVSLAACATDPGTSPDGTDIPRAADGAFPVTIEHAYGETTIEEQPLRVATVAWSNQEVPLALGIVPVGMAAMSWGDDDGDGVLPWVEARLEELGAETPVLFDETEDVSRAFMVRGLPTTVLIDQDGRAVGRAVGPRAWDSEESVALVRHVIEEMK